MFTSKSFPGLSRFSPFSFRSFVVVLLLASGAGVLLFIVQAAEFLPVRGENVYPESAAVVSAQRWASGLPLYEDYRNPPYLMTAFPPLWYAFLALGAKLGASDLDSLTFLGRLLSLASLFGAAALGYVWNRRLGLPVALSLLTPAFFLSFPILIPWAVTARPDFAAIFFAFLAICVISLRPTGAFVAFAAIAAALAFLVRHNAVAVPVAIVLWMAWSRRWRHAALFCAVWGLAVGIALLPFLLSGDGLLVLNLSGAKFGVFAFTYVRDLIGRLLSVPGNGFALALFALGAFGLLQSWKAEDDRRRLASIYALATLILAVMGTAAAGGGVNHYLEPALAFAVLIPAGLARLQEVWNSETPFASFAVIVLLVFLLASVDAQLSARKRKRPENLQQAAALVENRTVFSDLPYLAARSASPQSLDLASLINAKIVGGWAGWSSSGLVGSLQGRQYELVILSRPVERSALPAGYYPRAPRIDSDVQAAIAENYSLCFELDAVYVYALKDPLFHGGRCPSNDAARAQGRAQTNSN